MTDQEFAAVVRAICGTEDNDLAEIKVRYAFGKIADIEPPTT